MHEELAYAKRAELVILVAQLPDTTNVRLAIMSTLRDTSITEIQLLLCLSKIDKAVFDESPRLICTAFELAIQPCKAVRMWGRGERERVKLYNRGPLTDDSVILLLTNSDWGVLYE